MMMALGLHACADTQPDWWTWEQVARVELPGGDPDRTSLPGGRRISFDLPDDAVGALVHASWDPDADVERLGRLWLSRVESPYGPFVDDDADAEALLLGQTASYSFPDRPERPVAAGTYTVEVRSWATGPAEVWVAIRRGAATPRVTTDLNLLFVDGSFTTAEQTLLLEHRRVLHDLFARAGIRFRRVRVGHIHDGGLADWDADAIGVSLPDDVAVTFERGGSVTLAANVVFVSRVLDDSWEWYETMGVAPSPGKVGGTDAAIVARHMPEAPLPFDAATIWYRVAHELGHYWGLRHTTEFDNSMFDNLADTPECDVSDEDPPRWSLRCPDADNLMAPMYPLVDEGPPTITDDQAWVLRHNVFMLPE